MLETISGLFIAAAPAITAVIGIIAAVKKCITTHADKSKEVMNELIELKKEVKDSKEYDNLKDQLTIVHQENVVLKKKINELLTKIDRVARKEDHDEDCECEKCKN